MHNARLPTGKNVRLDSPFGYVQRKPSSTSAHSWRVQVNRPTSDRLVLPNRENVKNSITLFSNMEIQEIFA